MFNKIIGLLIVGLLSVGTGSLVYIVMWLNALRKGWLI
jgi:hypothetical protein